MQLAQLEPLEQRWKLQQPLSLVARRKLHQRVLIWEPQQQAEQPPGATDQESQGQ